MMMYEIEKVEFERELAQCGLMPTPGNFWMAEKEDPEDAENTRLVPVDGWCCALSPMMLKHQAATAYQLNMLFYSHMPYAWFSGAIEGFDDTRPLDYREAYRDGYEWGQLMRERYAVLPAEDAQ